MRIHYTILLLMGFSALLFANIPRFQSSISPIPPKIKLQMQQFTWRKGCPLALNDLLYIRLSYWGFDKKIHTGSLIVNKKLGPEVVSLFKILFRHQFPIQSMKIMDEYRGDDKASMAANNTSAFNCRPITDRPGKYSQHSYGRAIDINPLINPYIKGKKVLPPQGIYFVDRSQSTPGKIIKGDFVYHEFIKYGWDWAGDWYDLQDYQHFEKRAGGKKRNPYGY